MTDTLLASVKRARYHKAYFEVHFPYGEVAILPMERRDGIHVNEEASETFGFVRPYEIDRNRENSWKFWTNRLRVLHLSHCLGTVTREGEFRKFLAYLKIACEIHQPIRLRDTSGEVEVWLNDETVSYRIEVTALAGNTAYTFFDLPTGEKMQIVLVFPKAQG